MRVALMVSALCLGGAALGLAFSSTVLSAADGRPVAGQIATAGVATPQLRTDLLRQLSERAAQLEKQDPDEAAALYRRMLEQFADDPRATMRASDRLRAYHVARFERAPAETHYARQLAADPSNAKARGKWAEELLLTFADYDAAITTAREALALADDAPARRTLALALYMKWSVLLSHRRAAEAQPFYDEASRLWSDLGAVTQVAGQYRALEIVHLAITERDSWAFRPYRIPPK